MTERLEAPLASVVVLTYDRPRLLARCLESLAVQDLGEPYEIVVADDGSGAETAETIERARSRDPRIRHVHHEHQGIPATRNLGASAARGRYVAIVADDYVLSSSYLSRAIRYLEAHPGAAVVRFDILPLESSFGARVSHCYYWSSFLGRLASEGLTPADIELGVATTTLEASGAAVFRAEVLEAVGPWNTALQRGEDTEHSARLRTAGYEVHVLAAGTVRQQYRRLPVDTFRKCFLTGFYRSRLESWVPGSGLRGLLAAARLALRRARYCSSSAASTAWLVSWITLFQIAVGAGYRWGVITRRRDAASAGSGAAGDPPRR